MKVFYIFMESEPTEGEIVTIDNPDYLQGIREYMESLCGGQLINGFIVDLSGRVSFDWLDSIGCSFPHWAIPGEVNNGKV